MDIIIFLLAWYLVGWVIFIVSIFCSGEITVGDLMFGFIAALVGPIILVIWLYTVYGDEIRNKVIWRRK